MQDWVARPFVSNNMHNKYNSCKGYVSLAVHSISFWASFISSRSHNCMLLWQVKIQQSMAAEWSS